MTILFGKIFGVILIAIALIFTSFFNEIFYRNTIYKTHILTLVSDCFLWQTTSLSYFKTMKYLHYIYRTLWKHPLNLECNTHSSSGKIFVLSFCTTFNYTTFSTEILTVKNNIKQYYITFACFHNSRFSFPITFHIILWLIVLLQYKETKLHCNHLSWIQSFNSHKSWMPPANFQRGLTRNFY